MGIAMTFNEEMLDVARAAYLAARGESDLIPIKEAATLVDRTVPTLRNGSSEKKYPAFEKTQTTQEVDCSFPVGN